MNKSRLIQWGLLFIVIFITLGFSSETLIRDTYVKTDDSNTTNIYTTNLYATNLEQDLDGTGFDLKIDDLNITGNVKNTATCVVDLDGYGDYTDIQSCIDSISNGTVYVKDNLFSISDTIELKSKIALHCDAGTILQLAVSTDKDMFNTTNGATEVKIIGCNIDANDDGQGDSSYAIKFYNTTNSLVQNCNITDSRDGGIFISGIDSEKNVIDNNWIHYDFSGGGVLVDGSDNKITNNHIRNDKITLGAGYCIYVRQANSTLVDGNYMYGGEMGVGLAEVADEENIVTNNFAFNTFDAGYKISGSVRGIISNNWAINCTYGFDVSGAGTNDITLSNNYAYESGAWGFYVGVNNSIIIGNTAKNSGQTTDARAGLTLVNAYNNTVIGNLFYDDQASSTQDYGILESSGSDENIYIGNKLRNNNVSDMTLVGTHNIVVQDSISGMSHLNATRGYVTNWNVSGTLTVGTVSADSIEGVNSLYYAEPILNLQMNRNSSSTIYDYSKFDNDGTLSGGTWVSNCKYGGAYDFDGTDDEITVSASSELNISESITVMCFVKYDYSGAVKGIIDKRAGSGVINYRIIESADGSLACDFYDGTSEIIPASGTAYNDDIWHHVACVRNADTNRALIYVDGILEDNDTDTTVGVNLLAAGGLTIGDTGESGKNFNGTIDEVRLYDRALTTNEIKALAVGC